MYANLAYAMKVENITQEEISRELGCHRNTVKNKLDGLTPVTLEEAGQLWQRFFPKYDFQWLFRKLKTDQPA